MDPKRFKEYRRDGYPLCPECGDDELVSAICMLWPMDKPSPKIEEVLEGGFHCLNCNFMDD